MAAVATTTSSRRQFQQEPLLRVARRFLDGLGGTKQGGKFFGYVDDEDLDDFESKKDDGDDKNSSPTTTRAINENTTGTAVAAADNAAARWWRDFLNLKYFLYSPNLVWFLLACATWTAYPYDVEAYYDAGRDDGSGNAMIRRAILKRVAFNYAVCALYYGFWHYQLYWAGASGRPFDRRNCYYYSWARVLHNVFYTSLGSLQWSLTECAFLYGYATGRIPYRPMSSTLAVWMHLAMWSLLVPLVRDAHFYFAHRFLHAVPFVYKYVHAVHHRNTTDVEPFSGMTMHPVEHMYYFACYFPLLLYSCFCVHPFVLMWTGVHVTLSPAASHSGFGDHWQSDRMHYFHHAYFECNYGTAGLPFDKWFGTYRLDDNDKPDSSKVNDINPRRALSDTKATLYGGGWSLDHVAYWFLAVVVHSVVLYNALQFSYGDDDDDDGNTTTESRGRIVVAVARFLPTDRRSVALIISVGPIVEAAALYYLGRFVTSASRKGRLRMRTTSDTAPPKSAMQSSSSSSLLSYCFPMLMGVAMTVAPVYGLVSTLLSL